MSPAAREAASVSMLVCNTESAEERADASLLIAVVFEATRAEISPSTFWNSETISVNESRAAESVLEITLSNLASMRASSPDARNSSAAIASAFTPSAVVARKVSAAIASALTPSAAVARTTSAEIASAFAWIATDWSESVASI